MRGAEPMRKGRGRVVPCPQGGFTLIELLLAATLALVVIGGSVTVLFSGIRSEPRIAERAADVQGARVAMEKLTREIRQGTTVTSATATQLSLVTSVNSASCGGPSSVEARPCLVSYACSSGICRRREANVDGSAPGPWVVVAKGISSAPVFTYTPSAADPGYVGIRLEFPAASGDDAITLTDGAAMRNAGDPGA